MSTPILAPIGLDENIPLDRIKTVMHERMQTVYEEGRTQYAMEHAYRHDESYQYEMHLAGLGAVYQNTRLHAPLHEVSNAHRELIYSAFDAQLPITVAPLAEWVTQQVMHIIAANPSDLPNALQQFFETGDH